MMTDTDLENIYKANVGNNHYAGLRGVYDAGFAAGQAITPNTLTPDQSLTATVPALVETIIAS